MKKKCNHCEDWKPNMEILNGIVKTFTRMSWGNPKGYGGKKYEYCPWCGNKLVEDYD